ncbi:hypothetical protein RHMOL_Rhmol09G0135200 [Rhododendron molle]|uniref:Uncharacterized protein n=1 Tax=Rhododendron molle TaxID=49168 RepID=A0ACC0ME92_RHOML|nr:hypothetical protein RHMOL_Rhmol09G0135200 [Rhododendron molle]
MPKRLLYPLPFGIVSTKQTSEMDSGGDGTQGGNLVAVEPSSIVHGGHDGDDNDDDNDDEEHEENGSQEGKRAGSLILYILHASESKKILNAQFDKLPLHGLGKELSANWWKALGYQLISHCMYAESGDFFCYLTDTIRDTIKIVRYLLKLRTKVEVNWKLLIWMKNCGVTFLQVMLIATCFNASSQPWKRSHFLQHVYVEASKFCLQQELAQELILQRSTWLI